MPSQVLTDTQKLAEDIVTAIDAHTAELDASASARLAADLHHGEKWPSVALLLALTSRRVKRTLGAHVDAERALDAERADDVEPRAERDKQALAVYAQLKKIKGAVESLFGDSVVRKLQLPAELPRDPAKLCLAGDDVTSAIKREKLPAPQVEGIGRVDSKAWIEALAKPLADLKKARAKVNLEDKELAAALAARDRAQEALSEAMVEALTFARAAASLADKDSLFDGLRATIDYGSSPSGGDAPADPVNPDPPGGPTPARPA
ncbi:MAG: hypothetical protein U0326_00645 [Polyangiales bacterium]